MIHAIMPPSLPAYGIKKGINGSLLVRNRRRQMDVLSYTMKVTHQPYQHLMESLLDGHTRWKMRRSVSPSWRSIARKFEQRRPVTFTKVHPDGGEEIRCPQ